MSLRKYWIKIADFIFKSVLSKNLGLKTLFFKFWKLWIFILVQKLWIKPPDQNQGIFVWPKIADFKNDVPTKNHVFFLENVLKALQSKNRGFFKKFSKNFQKKIFWEKISFQIFYKSSNFGLKIYRGFKKNNFNICCQK